MIDIGGYLGAIDLHFSPVPRNLRGSRTPQQALKTPVISTTEYKYYFFFIANLSLLLKQNLAIHFSVQQDTL